MTVLSDAEKFLRNNTQYLEKARKSKAGKLAFFLTPGLKRLYEEYVLEDRIEQKSLACAKVLNAYEESAVWRYKDRFICMMEYVRIFRQQKGYRNKAIDFSGKKTEDYYSVAVIVKNEARYIREFILFYRATGADRIYIYDNDSTDNLLEELKPFLETGFVVYRYLHGARIQTFAYRDAVRRTRRRTKWLALIDADEFLFSPKGGMPEQLKAFEQFPGVGVNWVMFGPSGHHIRPEGLIMDNYTETYADPNKEIDRHIKSIVQPAKVFSVPHPHFAVYKDKSYAVNEQGDIIDNYCAYVETAGKAFTYKNNREVFRINHYYTKSLEDLREKCDRGYADGTPNIDYEKILERFDDLTTEDHAIKKYADIVRKEYCLY